MAQLKSGSTVGGSGIVTKGDNQALHDTDALRISGSTVSLYKGDGTSESVALPSSAPTAAQVGQAYSDISTLSIGWIAIAVYKQNSTTLREEGFTVAGSTLYQQSYQPCLGGSEYNRNFHSLGFSGTWRCMTRFKHSQNSKSDYYYCPTLWQRIA